MPRRNHRKPPKRRETRKTRSPESRIDEPEEARAALSPEIPPWFVAFQTRPGPYDD